MSELATKPNVDNTDNISSSASAVTNTIKVDWSPENESIMVEWCDIAQCYKWLNSRAHSRYSYMHAWFTIPAIVLSTITGTASFAQTSLPIEYQAYAPMAIGTVNIFIGILTTIQQYLKISELNEAHRVSAISWDKFARNIRIELAKKPSERMDAGHFLKLSRQEFDRLMETSPSVDAKIIKAFNSTLQGKPGSIERKRFDELKKPDICNTIVSANEIRHHWYLELNKETDSFDNTSIDEQVVNAKDNLIQAQAQHIADKTAELKRTADIAAALFKVQQQHIADKTAELKCAADDKKQADATEAELILKQSNDAALELSKQLELIAQHITDFEKIYERNPVTEELRDNMKDLVNVTTLEQFLNTYSADTYLANTLSADNNV
jgi:hypothetical protein